MTSNSITFTPFEHLAVHAMEMMSASGLRHRAFTILVKNLRASINYFDRYGALCSSEINIASPSGQTTFARLISILGLMNREEYGFISRFDHYARWPATSKPKIPDLALQGQTYTVPFLQLLNEQRVRGLFGRGSAVYAFEHGGNSFVMKLSWQPPTRTPEWQFYTDNTRYIRTPSTGEVKYYKCANDIGGMPKLVGHEDILRFSEGMRGELHKRMPGFVAPFDGEDWTLRVLLFHEIYRCRTLDTFPILLDPMGFLRAVCGLVISECS